ncbi:MAG: helix-turn-helix domain-containing protein [Planctomycetota bacterium]
MLAENPFWRINRVAERLGVAYTTAQRAVDTLVSLGILEQIGQARRDRFYCAGQIMAILDEPSRITE